MKNTDLQTFVKLFQVGKFKTLTTGIEVRGVVDLDRGISEAHRVIESNGLSLKVVNTAEMAAYRAFEVRMV